MPLHLESATVIDCGPNRTASRCVSWSASGLYLAFGSSDRLARLVTVEPTQAREVLVISGHQGPVTQTLFHPVDKTLVRSLVTRRREKHKPNWPPRLFSRFTLMINVIVFFLIRFLSMPTINILNSLLSLY